MADSKWIEGLHPSMPVEEAARTVLEVRLEAVIRRLPQALEQAEEDPEHVHQLRVSTRRAAAALRIFAAYLPDKSHNKLRKYLRRIRRSAGEARDWDVFLQSLTDRLTSSSAGQKPGLDFLLGFGHSQRLAAQEYLLEANQENKTQGETLLQTTLENVAAPQDPGGTLADLARPLLTELVAELEQAANQDLNDYEHLHQVRILGKRLRYAMEIFACCFNSDFHERIYPAVEEMQEILGLANDSYVACERLKTMRTHLKQTQPEEWKRWQPGIEGLLHYHQRRLPKHRRTFQQWWKKWHGSELEMWTTISI
jgi:CHAD domain-containing protein